MAAAISQQELESRLWAAANSLRGPVDPSDFKAYIFPLLFYKRLSDGWDEEHARALADFGGDETLAALPENHRFQIPEGCHWRDLRRVHENVGVALQRMLDRIQEANAETLAGIFGDVAWANKEKLPEHALSTFPESGRVCVPSSRNGASGAEAKAGVPPARTTGPTNRWSSSTRPAASRPFQSVRLPKTRISGRDRA